MKFIKQILAIVVFYTVAVLVLTSCSQPHFVKEDTVFKLWEYNTPHKAYRDCDTVITYLDKTYPNSEWKLLSIEEVDDGYTLILDKTWKGHTNTMEVWYYDFDEDPSIEIYLESMFISQGK